MRPQTRVIVCSLSILLGWPRPTAAQQGFGFLHSFPGSFVATGPSEITQTANGDFFVTTSSGRSAPGLLRVTSSGVVSTVHIFDTTYRGDTYRGPAGRLVQAADGSYYGTTLSGGDFDQGSIYRVLPDGTLGTVYSFTNSNDGANPRGRLVRSANGYIYGGAWSRRGLVFFAITPGGAVQFLTDIVVPGATSTFTVAPDGTIYGIGSLSLYGSLWLYQRSPNGAVAWLHNFNIDASHGFDFDLEMAADGTLFGVAPPPQDSSLCSVFRFAPLSFVVLKTFGSPCRYADRAPALVEGSDGSLYGNLGPDLFRFDRAGAYTSLHQLSGNEGTSANDLIFGADGAVWGTTASGGFFGGGSIFRLTPTGQFATVKSFTAAGNEGTDPSGALMSTPNGDLYGTTARGGLFDQGTIFRLTRTGVFTNVYTFTGRGDGGGPRGLVLGSDGSFYGTTATTFFRIAPSGALTTLYTFRGPGNNPGPIMQARDGFFYGRSGFGRGDGTAFRLSRAGDVTILHQFSNADGIEGLETAPFVQAADGNLYAATRVGGFYEPGYGSVYRMTLGGNVTLLHRFGSDTIFRSDAGWPTGRLVPGIDGRLYGAIASYDNNRVFAISQSGEFILLPPLPELFTDALSMGLGLRSEDGAFYGVAWGVANGGNGGVALLFRLTSQGRATVLQALRPPGRDSFRLAAESLLDGGNGQLYGYSSNDFGHVVYLPVSRPVISSRPTAVRGGDFDGDGKADVGVFRPSNGTWYVLNSRTNGATSIVQQWAMPGDVPVPGDYDGDGKTDLAVYRPSNGTWYAFSSASDNSWWIVGQWGMSGDVPVPGDYDGDGTTDMAVFRPSISTWYMLSSSTQNTSWTVAQWGLPGDIPVPGDYDGDGKSDPAVYRPSTGSWYVLNSSTRYTTWTVVQWGFNGDTPVPGDYDGDGRTDPAIFRPSTGAWYLLKSSTNYASWSVVPWGAAGDVPVPRDYDGDAKTDVAIYRPSTGYWYILSSRSANTTWTAYQWGVAGDVPITASP